MLGDKEAIAVHEKFWNDLGHSFKRPCWEASQGEIIIDHLW